MDLKNRLLFLTMFLFIICLKAQLKSFIGLDHAPDKTDSICPIQNYLGDFEDSGYQTGDTVHDFTIYNLDNLAWSLSEVLKKGKPVLLISSSYTCPVFRDKITSINELARLFSGQLEVIVVYTVEAHPDKDISPYFGTVHTGGTNIREGILYRQPKIYDDRLKIVEDMLSSIKLDVPVYIDGPCNEWWYHYGPAPNNATLIDVNGIVQLKHAWYDREPDNIICDVKKYFDPKAVCDSIPQGIGSFTFTMSSDSIVKGEVNTAMYVSGIIQNNTNVPVTIELKRLINNMPLDWASSICLDVCYPTTLDSTRITLATNTKINLIIDIFTGPVPAKGAVKIGMRNVDNSQNKAFMNAQAITQDVSSASNNESFESDVVLYPNPVSSELVIKTEKYQQFALINSIGCIVQNGEIYSSVLIKRNSLPSGIYFLNLENKNGQHCCKMVIFN